MVGVAQSGQSSGLWTRASPVRIRSLTLVLRRTLKPDPGGLPEWTKGAVCKTVGLVPALVRTQHLPRHGLYGTRRLCRGQAQPYRVLDRWPGPAEQGLELSSLGFGQLVIVVTLHGPKKIGGL